MTRAVDRPAFSTADLAERWRVSLGHVRNCIRSGEVRAFKVGRSWRISADEVDRIERRAPDHPVGNGHSQLSNPWDSP